MLWLKRKRNVHAVGIGVFCDRASEKISHQYIGLKWPLRQTLHTHTHLHTGTNNAAGKPRHATYSDEQAKRKPTNQPTKSPKSVTNRSENTQFFLPPFAKCVFDCASTVWSRNADTRKRNHFFGCFPKKSEHFQWNFVTGAHHAAADARSRCVLQAIPWAHWLCVCVLVCSKCYESCPTLNWWMSRVCAIVLLNYVCLSKKSAR